MKKKNDAVEAEVVNESYGEYFVVQRRRSGLFWGLALILLGTGIILQDYLGINLWQYFWPALVTATGVWLVIRSL